MRVKYALDTMKDTTRLCPSVILLSALIAIGMGCGGEEQSATATTPPSVAPSVAPVEPPDPAPEPAAPSAPACVTALDCHLVHNRCGEPFARPLGDTDIPPAPDICPPVEYALQDLQCDDGCRLRDVRDREFRACASSDDCVALTGLCGRPAAVAVTQRAAYEAKRDELAARVRCAAPPTLPPMRAECDDQRLCVPRRQR